MLTDIQTLINIISQIKLFLFIVLIITLLNLFFFFFNKYYWQFNELSINVSYRNFLIKSTFFLSLFFFCMTMSYLVLWHEFSIESDNLNILGLNQKKLFIEFNFSLIFAFLNFNINYFSLSIGLLFSILFPIIVILFNYDYSDKLLSFFLYMYLIIAFSYFLIFTNNIILFYLSYEFILILVFAIMYLSSNSRGGIEATIFFAGWAILGSILVGLGIILLIVLSNEIFFTKVADNKLTASETYYIYFLFFFGFGTKLSTWPFWYWLPRAHVEVSTSMSIYLSCVLIKLSYFCLIKVQLILLSEISLNLFIIATLFCTIDVVFRLLNQKDLKALIAYSSVLHTNLLLTLIHLDMSRAMRVSMLYVWGHSLATACLFICVNLIELKFNSRNILYVSGLWNVSPSLACLTFWSLLSFLDFPCTMFFWGELWLWTILLANFPILAIQVIFFCLVIFASIFFKIWWGVLFGAPDNSVIFSDESDNYEIWIVLVFLIVLQLLAGLQPSIISSTVVFIV